MKIELKEGGGRLEEVRDLFREYASWIGLPLDFQDFDQELSSLPGKYAPPEGRLYLLEAGGRTVGCGALRPFDVTGTGERRCEMKRLYIREEARGRGLGRRLAQRLIEDAREEGYAWMLLDTFAFMERAIALYEHLGFQEISAYRWNPHSQVKYLALDLRDGEAP